jgi:quercetin 2,3-dioxygenase
MSFEFLIDPQHGPQWKNLLPGRPAPYVLRKGEGEHSMLFTDLFSVLLSGDETNNQFGIITSDCPSGDIIPTHSHNQTHETFYLLEGRLRLFFVDEGGTKTSKLLTPGDFGFVPAGTPHAYQVEESSRILGVMSGGFERFFQHMGTVTDNGTKDQPPFIPDFPRMKAAAQQHNMQFMPDYQWPDPDQSA